MTRPIGPDITSLVAADQRRHSVPGRHRQPHSPPSRASGATMATATAAAVVLGSLAGVAALAGHRSLVILLLLGAVGLPCGILATWLAFFRFEVFLLALFAVRPLLDAFKPSDPTSSLSPSVAVGLLFLVAALWRLYLQWRQGKWVQLSWMTLGFMTMPLAELLTLPLSVSPSASFTAMVRLLAGTLMFVILEQELGSGTLTHRRLMRWVMVSILLVIPYCLVQEVTGFGLEFDTDIMATRVQGPFVHPSVLAKYLVILLLWMVAAWSASARRTRLVLAVGIAATVVVLELSLTRVAWGAALLGVLVILGRRSWRFVPILVAAAGVATVAIPAIGGRITMLFTRQAPVPGVPANSLQWRYEYWEQLVPLARMTPFNGLGAGTATIVGTDGLEPHNSWVQVYVETGVFGLAALLFTIACFFVTLRSTWRASRAVEVSSRHRAVADAAITCGVVLFVFMQTENLLSETSTLWYAAALTCGVVAVGQRSATEELPIQEPVGAIPAQTDPGRQVHKDRSAVNVW